MVSELARIGADDVIERLNNTDACDKACAWIWNACEKWKLPWEALNFAEQGHLKNVEKQFGPEMLQRVYQHIWSRDEMMPHKLPVLQVLATHGLHSSIRQHFGMRVEADACAWVWQRSRSWGQISRDVHGQKGLADVRLLDLDKSQDRMLANVDEHVQEIIRLRKERRELMAEEESLLRRALGMCRRSKGRSSLLEVPRMRPDGPLAPRRDIPLGADPKGMLGSMLHYGRKRRMYSPRVTHTIVKKPKLLPPFDVPHVVPCMVDGCNTIGSYIRTHTIPWATVSDSFQPVMTAHQTPRSVRHHAVDIPRFRRIVPVEAPAEAEAEAAAEAEAEAEGEGEGGGDSSDSEDTSDAKYAAMHKGTLASLKTRLDRLWKALDHKRQQALERRRQGVEKRKMQRKNNRRRTLLLSNSAQKLRKNAPSSGAANNAGSAAKATVSPVKRSAELFLDVEDSASQPANKKSRSSHGRRKAAASKRPAKKASTPTRTSNSPRPDSNLKKSTPKSTKKQSSSKPPRSPRTTTPPRESGNARRSTRSRTPRDSRATARTARQNPP